jgi:hypothetical protein
MSKLPKRANKLHADSTQRDAAFFRERERERNLAAEKTLRLRTLRLAKEASDREAAAAAAAAAPLVVPRKRKVAVVAESVE